MQRFAWVGSLLFLFGCSSSSTTITDGGGDVVMMPDAGVDAWFDPDSTPWPDQPCPGIKPSAEEQAARIQALKDVIHQGILMKQSAPVENLFDTNVDWHSSVHAHWALLQMARLTNDQATETFLQGRLTDAALDAERMYLSNNAMFEIPYGQSWLLMLLDELSKHRQSSSITQLRQDTEARIFNFLDTNSFPEGKVTILGDHYSWLFSYLLTTMSHPITANAAQHLYSLRQSKIEPARVKIPNMMPGDTDFLYIPAVLAVTDREDLTITMYPDYPVDDPYPFESPIDLSNAHTAGQAMCRIWPFAIESQMGDQAACSRYFTRMKEMFNRPDQWKNDYQSVSHWVPQFMWLGMWLEQGRP
jgi:hypothetical protein